MCIRESLSVGIDSNIFELYKLSYLNLSDNSITGEISAASGTVDTSYGSTLLGVTFSSGLAAPEIENNSGNVIYVENRRLITRAPDQIEDIKLVIEF